MDDMALGTATPRGTRRGRKTIDALVSLKVAREGRLEGVELSWRYADGSYRLDIYDAMRRNLALARGVVGSRDDELVGNLVAPDAGSL